MGMRRWGGWAGAWLVLLLAARADAGASRVDCTAACATLVASCTSTCSAFGDLDAACRRAVLRRCRREGVEVCSAPTSSTVTSTTHTTTTTLRPTTTTTIPAGLDCSAPRPLGIGVTESGDTMNGSDHGPGVGCMQNSESPDMVYVVVPDTDGTLVLSLTSAWDGGVYVRTDCTDAGTELACQDQLGTDATETLRLPVTAGTTYYVFVDGYATDQAGPFDLTTSLE